MASEQFPFTLDSSVSTHAKKLPLRVEVDWTRSPHRLANDRNVRTPDGSNRREADIAERDRRRLNWAESERIGVVSIRFGFRAKAAVQLRTRKRVHRPGDLLCALKDGRNRVRTFRPLGERVWPIFACCGWKDAHARRRLLDPPRGYISREWQERALRCVSRERRVLAGALVGKPLLPFGRVVRPLRHLDAPGRRPTSLSGSGEP
jgi:hypothetical protein